jgi:hypothetical protein
VAGTQFILATPTWAALEGPSGVGVAAVVWVPLLAASFLIAGIFLVHSGRRDPRAVHLAVVFAGVVAAFSATPASRFAATLSGVWQGAALATVLRVEVLLPYALWSFARGFPRAETPWDPWVDRVARATLVIGSALALLHVVDRIRPVPGASPFLRYAGGGGYWGLLLVLSLPAFAALLLRMRRAGVGERRRARLLLAGVVLGGAPICILSLVDALIGIPPGPAALSGWVVYAALATVPATTAYAALVDRALDVSLVLRRTLQYAMARYTLLSTGMVPLVALAVVLFRNRAEPVGALFFGPRSLTLLLLSAGSFVLLRVRRSLLDAIDRRFFREQYDAQELLRSLVRESREAVSTAELETSLLRRIEAALHPRWLRLLRLRSGDGWLVASEGRFEPLESAGPLLSAMARRGRVVQSSEARAMADSEERAWLERQGVALLIPLVGSGQELLGVVALGPKRSEMPYTTEDRTLLGTAAEAVALRLDRLAELEGMPQRGPDRGELAAECRACGSVQPSEGPRAACRICGGDLVEALLPPLAAGKFAVIRRLGEGGRGRAYLAEDRHLSRPVALKILEDTGAAAATRLAREARALAAVSHPHVAAVHSLENVGGRSVLVLEYLSGGTLAERLRRGPLTARGLLRLVDQLAAGLEHLHRQGILHRDIKPSNVGFSAQGAAKLLDFGQVSAEGAPRGGAAHPHGESGLLMRSNRLPGTAAYMSPEALAGAPPSAADDIWALAVLTWESATGTNPFVGISVHGTIARVASGRVPAWETGVQPPIGALGKVLQRAFSPVASERWSSARDFGSAVGRVLERR